MKMPSPVTVMLSEHEWEAIPNPLRDLPSFRSYSSYRYRWHFQCVRCGIAASEPWREDPACYECLRIVEPDNYEIWNDCDCPVCEEGRGEPEYETCSSCGGLIGPDEHCTNCYLWRWHPAHRVPHYGG